ncbi:hypothetical protein GUJ93_ZPchr0006g45085 [Zizania palustris]|uniref:NB-ARC domain-containing protein n=1 Tax=Zizania palustris TaxID=103762 RepID=A0A8J5W3G4_ZIZPA|nr:hypothetical protein GUJ93_ZPchr0006g45085 [Zizania palustris]
MAMGEKVLAAIEALTRKVESMISKLEDTTSLNVVDHRKLLHDNEPMALPEEDAPNLGSHDATDSTVDGAIDADSFVVCAVIAADVVAAPCCSLHRLRRPQSSTRLAAPDLRRRPHDVRRRPPRHVCLRQGIRLRRPLRRRRSLDPPHCRSTVSLCWSPRRPIRRRPHRSPRCRPPQTPSPAHARSDQATPSQPSVAPDPRRLLRIRGAATGRMPKEPDLHHRCRVVLSTAPRRSHGHVAPLHSQVRAPARSSQRHATVTHLTTSPDVAAPMQMKQQGRPLPWPPPRSFLNGCTLTRGVLDQTNAGMEVLGPFRRYCRVWGTLCISLDLHKCKQLVLEAFVNPVIETYSGKGRRCNNNDHGNSSVNCVNGISGIGKTELVLEFAYRYSLRCKIVFWIGSVVRFWRQNILHYHGYPIRDGLRQCWNWWSSAQGMFHDDNHKSFSEFQLKATPGGPRSTTNSREHPMHFLDFCSVAIAGTNQNSWIKSEGSLKGMPASSDNSTKNSSKVQFLISDQTFRYRSGRHHGLFSNKGSNASGAHAILSSTFEGKRLQLEYGQLIWLILRLSDDYAVWVGEVKLLSSFEDRNQVDMMLYAGKNYKSSAGSLQCS